MTRMWTPPGLASLTSNRGRGAPKRQCMARPRLRCRGAAVMSLDVALPGTWTCSGQSFRTTVTPEGHCRY